MQSTTASQETLLAHILLQIIVVIIAGRSVGWIALRLGQPRAVGEIAAGLMLGPSLFGALAPDIYQWTFLSTDPKPIHVMSQIGLIMLMFQVGMEFEFSLLTQARNRKAVVLVSLFGLVIPFGLGMGFGWYSAPVLAPQTHWLAYSLFLGVALAITAVPILGRILMDFKLASSRIGVITIAAAAANDAVGWLLLAFVSAFAAGNFSLGAAAAKTGLFVGYVVFAWFLVRHGLLAVIRRFDRGPQALPQDLLAILLAIVFSSAMLTSQLGIFAIFGGFLVGVLLHDQAELAEAWRHKVSDLVTVLFLPIFFTYTGLRTDIGSLQGLDGWSWCLLLIVLAVTGKVGGGYVAARMAGLPKAEARTIGVLMNTRALMELVVANLGYDLGVIPREVFTMLVLMALVSTLMTAPGLRRCLPGTAEAIAGPTQTATARRDPEP